MVSSRVSSGGEELLKEVVAVLTAKILRPNVITASGFILLKQHEDGDFRVLGLLQPGGYDTTKGHLEAGEMPLEGAIREAHEEASIDDVAMPWGERTLLINTLLLYVGLTQRDGKIKPNPETGELEHMRVRWMTFDEAKLRFHDFLIPAVEWAEKIVLGGM